jgi:hypothetical protein
MSLDLNAGDRKILLIAGAVLLLLIVGTLLLNGGAGDAPDVPTTYSAGSNGAKAAYLLLESSGYRVTRSEQGLPALSEAAQTTLILVEPERFPTAEERGLLRQFLEGGGRVIATGPSGALFLPEHDAVPDPIGGLAWKRVTSQSPSSITRAAPEITLAPQASWTPASYAVPLYAEGDKQVVVTYRFARGEVIWWASATPLTNAGLLEPGNVEFFLACVGAKDRRRVLWDEYFHGYGRASAASARLGPLKWVFLQLGIFTGAVLVTYSRRSGPIVYPATERRLSPLEFVRTLGSLYQRAGATSVAVDISYQRFRYWLTRRVGTAGDASVDELERAVRERWHHADAAFGATLRACESARDDVDLTPRAALKLTRSLHEYTTKLESLGKWGRP